MNWLHLISWKETGQALPPNLGSVVVRARVWVPVERVVWQLWAQVLQEDQAATSQSTAHFCWLQSWVCKTSGHRVPFWTFLLDLQPGSDKEQVWPSLKSMVILRMRFWLPIPQEAVQAFQEDQAPTSQWTGQGPWLHVTTLRVGPQAAPP
jgi:hypothetical protein